MGSVVLFQQTKRSILRAAKREMVEMYRLSCGGQDPIPSNESRESFEMGLLEEVAWQDWDTFCLSILRRLFEDGNQAE